MLKPRLYIVGIEHPSTGATSFPAYEPGAFCQTVQGWYNIILKRQRCATKNIADFVFLCFYSVPKASIMHSCSESNQRCECACDLYTRAANKLKEAFSSWWKVPMVFPTLNFHDMKHLADLRWSWCKPMAARTTTPAKDSNHHHVGECLWSSRIPLLGGTVDTINEKEIPICSFFVSSQFSRRWKNERSHFWPIYWIPYAPNTAGS